MTSENRPRAARHRRGTAATPARTCPGRNSASKRDEYQHICVTRVDPQRRARQCFVMWSSTAHTESQHLAEQFGAHDRRHEGGDLLSAWARTPASSTSAAAGYHLQVESRNHTRPSSGPPGRGTGVGGIVRIIHGRAPDRRQRSAALRRCRPPRHGARRPRRRLRRRRPRQLPLKRRTKTNQDSLC